MSVILAPPASPASLADAPTTVNGSTASARWSLGRGPMRRDAGDPTTTAPMRAERDEQRLPYGAPPGAGDRAPHLAHRGPARLRVRRQRAAQRADHRGRDPSPVGLGRDRRASPTAGRWPPRTGPRRRRTGRSGRWQRRPLSCSGAMYCRVPIAKPSAVKSALSASASRAIPKSPRRARPSTRKMLAGLMSRWMMPASCDAARARQRSLASRSSSGPSAGRPRCGRRGFGPRRSPSRSRGGRPAHRPGAPGRRWGAAVARAAGLRAGTAPGRPRWRARGAAP